MPASIFDAPITISAVVLIFLAMVIPAFTYVAGFFGSRMTSHPAGREISRAIKKGTPVQFLLGHDRKLRVIGMSEGKTGYWHEKDFEMIPDPKGTYSLYGTQAGIATSEVVSNLNSKFIMLVNAWRKKQLAGDLKSLEDALGRNIGTSPEELGRALYESQNRMNQISTRLEFLKKSKMDEQTIAEYIKEQHMDKEESALFRQEISKAQADNGLNLEKELEALQAATQITIEEEGWGLKAETPGKQGRKAVWSIKATKGATKQVKYSLVRTIQVTLDDLWAVLPSGSNVSQVWTMIKRSAIADRLESDWGDSKVAKWVTIAMFIMMSTIGAGIMVYLSTGK